MLDRVSGLQVRIEEYWGWIAVALFLLITVDMLTTIYAAVEVGVGIESNPLMQWALTQGILTVAAINLAATLIAVLLFYGLIELVHQTEPPYDLVVGLMLEVFLGVIIAVGLAIFANNLSVIVFHRSLLT
jgi:lysylphosphatidylglycerol synthetase-like protein (DUF2156 family)